MSWWKGAGIGFLRGGPLGAIIGGTAEHFISKKIKKKQQEKLPGVVHQGQFITCLVVILTRVGMEAGPIGIKKAGVIHNFIIKNMGYAPEDLKPLDGLIREVQAKKPDLEQFIGEYKASCKNNYNLLILALCYQIILVENDLDKEIESLIKVVGLELGVSYDSHNELRKKYSLDPFKTPYSILEISSDASNEEIKKAYRKLASLHHPDRVSTGNEEVRQEAHLKFLEIQSAYKELEKVRNI